MTARAPGSFTKNYTSQGDNKRLVSCDSKQFTEYQIDISYRSKKKN